MHTEINQVRRAVVISTVGAAALAVTAGCNGNSLTDRQLQFASLGVAAEELAWLAQAKELVSGATWNWAQTLVHCAQSIEFSMAGFPRPKSELFQRTAGAAAFGVFSWRGRMTHDLADPIPGAPTLEAQADPAQSLERLQMSIADFQRWSGPLHPHFAYGVLNKKEYELAHAMHLANHLSGFQIKS